MPAFKRFTLAIVAACAFKFAFAAPISYQFEATSITKYGDNAPANPARVAGLFTLDGLNVIALSMSIGTKTYDASDAVAIMQGRDLMVGGNNPAGCTNAPAASCMQNGTDDFWIGFDPSALTLRTFGYTKAVERGAWFTSTGSIQRATATVPEPSVVLLVGIAAAALITRKSNVLS